MKLVAFERAMQGTGASRRLRITGRTPGIVYGGDGEPSMIEMDHNTLWHAIKKEAFHSSILDMEVGGATTKVLLRNLQMHPFKQLILHADFQRVVARTKLHLKVPMHYVGEEESPAVKLDQCLVNHVVTELDVSCMPANLPEFIEVNLSGLKKGGSVHLSDVTLPRGVTAVKKGGVSNPVLVSVVNPASEAADAEVEGEATDAPAADGKPAAGAKGAPAAKGAAGGKAAPAAKGAPAAKTAPAAKAPAGKK